MTPRRFFAILMLWLLGCFATAAEAQIPSTERDALIAWYTSTDGANWNDRTNWRNADDTSFNDPGTECTWFGVTCNTVGDAVVEINLEDNYLHGHIPTAVGDFPKLEILVLSDNYLYGGGIPPEIGGLSSLKRFEMLYSFVIGGIPPELGNLGSLEYLNLWVNDIGGSIPPELGNLSNLEVLNLNGLLLSGHIPPELGSLSQLRWMGLSMNSYLRGPIPPELGNLSNLEVLDLSYNYIGHFGHGIPPELGNLSSLERMLLNDNRLSGSIPPELSQLLNLEDLYLTFNLLTGDLPPELADLPSLQRLNFSGNRLSGSIPPTFGNFPSLKSLGLSFNDLSGSIPPELGNLSNLETLGLRRNNLTGSIPPELGDFSNLEQLYLDENHLSGSIPPELGQINSLEWLYVSGNKLSGSPPPELGDPVGLRADIGYNRLSTDDPILQAILASVDADWDQTQTIAPVDIEASLPTSSSVVLEWTPIPPFFFEEGCYAVFLNPQPWRESVFTDGFETGDTTWWGIGNPWVATESRQTSVLVDGLKPGASYDFVIRSVTEPHSDNPNWLVSEPSETVSQATIPR